MIPGCAVGFGEACHRACRGPGPEAKSFARTISDGPHQPSMLVFNVEGHESQERISPAADGRPRYSTSGLVSCHGPGGRHGWVRRLRTMGPRWLPAARSRGGQGYSPSSGPWGNCCTLHRDLSANRVRPETWGPVQPSAWTSRIWRGNRSRVLAALGCCRRKCRIVGPRAAVAAWNGVSFRPTRPSSEGFAPEVRQDSPPGRAEV